MFLAGRVPRRRDQLLLHILDPNREVKPSFAEYVVELKDGRTVSGILAEESPGGVTLRRASNVSETLLRQQIERMTSSGLSIMPEGLEAAISPQAMADLLALLTKG